MGPLRQRVLEKIDAGMLPTVRPPKTWVGYGRRGICSICDDPILPAQIEYAFEEPTGAVTLQFHLGCHGLWDSACRHRETRRAPAASPDVRGIKVVLDLILVPLCVDCIAAAANVSLAGVTEILAELRRRHFLIHSAGACAGCLSQDVPVRWFGPSK
jgi:hypothetical protein